MDNIFDSNYFGKFSEEDYWNDTGITTNLFLEEEEDTQQFSGADLLHSDIEVLTPKVLTTIPINSLISQENLDIGNLIGHPHDTDYCCPACLQGQEFVRFTCVNVLCYVCANVCAVHESHCSVKICRHFHTIRDTGQDIVAAAQSIDDCIKWLFLGYSPNLYYYKSLDQKIELLDKAINTYDGNVIMTVILFLENTLNFNIFLQKVLSRKLALDHYCNYLLKKRDFDKLTSIQMIANDYFDMIDIFFLSTRHNDNNFEIRLKLDRHMSEHIGNTGFGKDILTNYKTFLDFQINKKLNYISAVELLAYKIKDNLEKQGTIDNTDTNELKSCMKITDFQYDWIKFNVVSALSMWNKILEFYIHSNRFTKKKEIKSILGKELIIMNLYKREAPKHILESILSAMPFDELTLHWAQKTKCYKYIINYHLSQKDRISLNEFKQTLSPSSEEFTYAESVLKSEKKWKN